jgi:hypothetical protein
MAEERPGYPYGARAMLLCLVAYTTSTFPPQLGPPRTAEERYVSCAQPLAVP